MNAFARGQLPRFVLAFASFFAAASLCFGIQLAQTLDLVLVGQVLEITRLALQLQSCS